MNSPRSCLTLIAACMLGLCLSAQAVVTLSPSGTNDRTADINNAIDTARGQASYVMLNSGTYYHSGQITVSGAVELRGNNDATVLLATTQTNCCVRVTGTNPKLRNLKVMTTWTGTVIPQSPQRTQNDVSSLVYIKEAVNFLVENVTATKGRSVGMKLHNSRGNSSADKARVINCRVRDTLADGIHLTGGCKWVRVENCTNTNTGDDLIAVVSYLDQPTICTEIIVTNNTVSANVWGRGLTVIGGSNITLSNNTVTNSNGSGINLASEGGDYNTFQVSGITVSNNTLTNPARRGDGQHGIHMKGRLNPATGAELNVSNVTLNNNTITNANGRGVVISNYTTGITLNNTKINGTAAAGVEINVSGTDVPSSGYPQNITITGTNTTTYSSYIKNTGAQGVSASRATGTLQIRNTLFEQINKTSGTANDVITVGASPLATATITGNHYTNPSSNGVQRYIEVSGSTPYTTPITPANTRTVTATPSSPTIFSP